MLKSFFLIFDSRNQKFDFCRLSFFSPAVRRQRADVSLMVPSAPRPRDSLELRLQQQWGIPTTSTVWRIQALAHRTIARGIVDQQLLRRRTGAPQLRRDKADIKRHPAVSLLHSPSQITADYYHTRYQRRHANQYIVFDSTIRQCSEGIFYLYNGKAQYWKRYSISVNQKRER